MTTEPDGIQWTDVGTLTGDGITYSTAPFRAAIAADALTLSTDCGIPLNLLMPEGLPCTAGAVWPEPDGSYTVTLSEHFALLTGQDTLRGGVLDGEHVRFDLSDTRRVYLARRALGV